MTQMAHLVLELALALFAILAAAELFTNALEHLGERLRLSDGVTGSLFAAVGTALPETLIPLLALLAGSGDAKVDEEIGIGAILGAPLMLSTLSICLAGLVVLPRRGGAGRARPERSGFVRDLDFFLCAFTLAAAAMWVPPQDRHLRAAVSAALVLVYCAYVALTLRASKRLVEDGHGTAAEKTMHMARVGLPSRLPGILLQMAAGLGLLLLGAKGFIDGVEALSQGLGISVFLLSLLIIPVATELPENVNSILWIRRGKDTLAFGNITGAMVLQGTLLPAIGILLTPWQPRAEVLGGVFATLAAAAWLRVWARRGGLPLWALWFNGALYASYVALTLNP